MGKFDGVGSSSPSHPAEHAAAVTSSDTADLPNFALALYIGGAGDVVVDTVGGETSVKFSAIPAGNILPVRVKRVRATGTTATLIIALY